jgi:hypothetical protein
MANPDDLEIFIELHGPAVHVARVPTADADALADRVPGLLVAFWKKHGVGIYAAGLLHLCDPRVYDPLLPLITHSDRDLAADDIAIYAFSAFGELLAWNRRYGAMTINLMTGEVFCPRLVKAGSAGDPDLDLESELVAFDRDLYDPKDTQGRPLFDRAVAAYGEPGINQCFGFVPALVLGGAPSLETIHRYPALEHFSILAQATVFTLVDATTFPPGAVRTIG